MPSPSPPGLNVVSPHNVEADSNVARKINILQKSGSMPKKGGGGLFEFWNGCLFAYLGSAIWVRPNYLGSENSRSQMCYLWCKTWA